MQQTEHNKQIGEHETKFTFNNARAKIVRQWLLQRCDPDPQFFSAVISSIYFDTTNYTFLHEKLSSDYLKTKVRIRWYSSFDAQVLFPPLFLEVKYKIGSARKKIRHLLPFGSEWAVNNKLDSPEFHQIRSILAEQGICINKPLLPVMQISYARTRYIEPFSGSRISIDSDIHVPRSNPALIPEIRHQRLHTAVFEYKDSSGKLPDYLLPIVPLSGCKKSSFSKYSSCYAQVKNITY